MALKLVTTQRCSNCFVTKPHSEFYAKLDRLQARCKACNAEVVAAYNDRKKGIRRLVREELCIGPLYTLAGRLETRIEQLFS